MNWFANILKTVTRWLDDLSPTCKWVVGLQSAALDHKLSVRQRLGLRIHLTFCRWCHRFGKQITFLNLAAKDHAHEDQIHPAPLLSSEARERIKQNLRAEQK